MISRFGRALFKLLATAVASTCVSSSCSSLSSVRPYRCNNPASVTFVPVSRQGFELRQTLEMHQSAVRNRCRADVQCFEVAECSNMQHSAIAKFPAI